MEYLDLTKHAPTEFLGKGIVIAGREYYLSRSIGRGTRARSFALTNTVSGETRLGLSVYDAGLPPEESDVTRVSVAEQASLFQCVSWVIRLEGPENQRITVSDLIDATPRDNDTLLAHADKLLDDGETEAAISAYNDIIANAPRSALAHHNLGVALSHCGRHDQAYPHLKLALQIEPMCPPSYLSLFTVCLHCRLAYEALAVYRAMKSLFPFECDMDQTTILLCLDMGQPMLAETMLRTAYLLEPTQALSLQEAVRQHLLNKQHAETLLKDSEENMMRRLRETGDIHAHEVLREAYATYDRDPVLAANYGLSLMRRGDTAKAKEILLAQIYRRDPNLDQICLLHAAFCEVSSAGFMEALTYLETLKAWLERRVDDGAEVNCVDVPGWTSYVIDLNGETASIQNPSRSLELMQQLQRGFGKHVPQTVRWFAKQFESQINMQHGRSE